jgi:hypothetical protein
MVFMPLFVVLVMGRGWIFCVAARCQLKSKHITTTALKYRKYLKISKLKFKK